MTVTVAAGDLVNHALQAQVAAVQTLVTAATNPAILANQVQTLKQLQQQLVMNLMSNVFAIGNPSNLTLGALAFLDPATILSTLTVNT
jgi:hypothetical protein